MLSIERLIPGVDSQIVFEIGGFRIANTTILGLIFALLFIFFLKRRIQRFSIIPNSSFQVVVESIYEGLITILYQITGSLRRAEAILPLVGTFMLYILFSNLSGIIPGLSSITYDGVSLFRAPTADFNTTLGLSVAAVLYLQYVSIQEWGIGGHIAKYFKFKEVFSGFRKGIKEGFLAVIEFGIGVLDIIGEFAKVLSLSFRLFGNIFAGEVLTIVIFGIIAYIVPAFFLAMGLLSAVVQAAVFGALVAVYYSLAIKEEGDTV